MLTFSFFSKYLFSDRTGALVRKLAWLCIFSTTIGVFSLVLVVSVMNGFNANIRSKLLKAEPHLVVNGDQDKLSVLDDVLDSEDIKVQRFVSQDVIIRTIDGVFSGGVARGLSSEAMVERLKRIKQPLKESSAVPAQPDSAYEVGVNEIVMGADLARNLGVFEGDRVVLIPPESLLLPPGEKPDYEKVTVKSLIFTEIQDVDTSTIFYNSDTSLRRFHGTASREEGIEIFLAEPEQYHALQAEIKSLGLEAESWAERNSALFFALRMEKIVMSTFLTLSALITSFSIITVLVLLVTQKRRDMGVLMALGLSTTDTKRIFIRIGLLLSGLGMGVGLSLGLIASYLLQTYPINLLPAEIYYDASIPAKLDWSMVSIIATGCVLVAVLAAWLPVRASVNMQPAEALRARARG